MYIFVVPYQITRYEKLAHFNVKISFNNLQLFEKKKAKIGRESTSVSDFCFPPPPRLEKSWHETVKFQNSSLAHPNAICFLLSFSGQFPKPNVHVIFENTSFFFVPSHLPDGNIDQRVRLVTWADPEHVLHDIVTIRVLKTPKKSKQRQKNKNTRAGEKKEWREFITVILFSTHIPATFDATCEPFHIKKETPPQDTVTMNAETRGRCAFMIKHTTSTEDHTTSNTHD